MSGMSLSCAISTRLCESEEGLASVAIINFSSTPGDFLALKCLQAIEPS